MEIVIYFTFFLKREQKSAVCCWDQQIEKNQLLSNDIYGICWTARIQLSFILLIPHFSKIMEPVMKVSLKNTFSST